MTDPSAGSFDELRLPVLPLTPRNALVADLRARLHRRLGFEAPSGLVPMPKAAGLEYEVGGDAGGDAVLFMHAGTATAYLPLMREPALADRHRLVRYHRRGYADSDGFDGTASIARHVDDALALLDELAIERAHVVGHSGSGPIAVELALAAPSRVCSLVLEEPAFHSIDPFGRDAVREAISFPLQRHRSGDTRGAIEMWMQSISLRWRADLARTVPGGPQQTVDDAAAFFDEVVAVDEWELDPSRVRTITAPVLYVIAADSPRHRATFRRFRELVPHAEAAVIPDATHMLHTDQPELVANELAGFFSRPRSQH
jgi:3-oxoadipate enol-lactonase